MKKIAYIIAGLFAFGVSSCSDMLEVDSSSQLSGQDINNKTDSVFYTFGIMSAMQQLADAYVLQNELRGDLVKLTSAADLDLQELANYSADGTNAYDSAYVYYRVINNVNYYLAHRDTTLADGSTNLVTNEYAAMLSFRAWAYLQAVRQYGKVKYITHPLTSISDIESDNSPELDIYQLTTELISGLEKYSGLPVPNYGAINCGSGNNSTVGSKNVNSNQSFIPVDVILGELYLERGQEGDYLRAAQHFYTYLNDNAASMYVQPLSGATIMDWFGNRGNFPMPSDFPMVSYSYFSWGDLSFTDQSVDIVSQIPMAQNYMRGATTNLPLLYGYNYYTANEDSLYTTVQIVPSGNYFSIADSTDCYYQSTIVGTGGQLTFNYFRGRDVRYYETYSEHLTPDSVSYRMRKFDRANVILYRSSTIWLRFAEALNRAGYPDAAFAILKDGLKSSLTSSNDYLSPETVTLLSTTMPILSPTNENDQYFLQNVGIHSFGAAHGESVTTLGINNGPIGGTRTPYQMDTIVGNKMAQIAREYKVAVGNTKADTINAVEDLICDEYAMEFAFEGTRYSDLTRLARRKNREAPASYGTNFGGLWFASKMAYKNPAKALDVEANWYLPFK